LQVIVPFISRKRGPTDVGTAREKDVDVALSTLVDTLNERFGKDFTEADQLFFDRVRSTAERDEKIVEAAQANNLSNFSAFFSRVLDDLFIQRMEGNDEIFNRVMSDKLFRTADRIIWRKRSMSVFVVANLFQLMTEDRGLA
jgi:type I restriction enzyme R subunit